MKLGYILSLCLFAFGAVGQAQNTNGLPEGYITLLRSDVKAKKVEIIRQNLTLTDEQSKTFWPLQQSYENELSKLGDERVNVIRDYAKYWDNLSDAEAKDLGNRMLDFQKKRVDLRRKYFDRISKDVSPTIAAKFFQVEMQLGNLIDLEIASSVPLVKVADGYGAALDNYRPHMYKCNLRAGQDKTVRRPGRLHQVISSCTRPGIDLGGSDRKSKSECSYEACRLGADGRHENCRGG